VDTMAWLNSLWFSILDSAAADDFGLTQNDNTLKDTFYHKRFQFSRIEFIVLIKTFVGVCCNHKINKDLKRIN
jgi:hypothetical protein